MAVYLECKEGGSSKFWQCEAAGPKTVVTYGKIGAAGQKSEQKHASASAATQFLEKMKTEKLKKGYKVAGKAKPKAKPASAPKKAAAPTKAAAPKKAAGKAKATTKAKSAPKKAIAKTTTTTATKVAAKAKSKAPAGDAIAGVWTRSVRAVDLATEQVPIARTRLQSVTVILQGPFSALSMPPISTVRQIFSMFQNI